MEIASRRRLLLVLPLLLPVLPVALLAQGGGGSLQAIAADTRSPERLAFLLQVPEGTTVRDAGEFNLLEDGRQTGRANTLQPFRNSGWSLATVLAVDTSGSVRGYIGEVRTALPEFVLQHPAGDGFAVVTFDDSVELAAPFGTPRDQVRARLNGLNARGQRTLLYAGLERSIETLVKTPRERTWRRLILVSDGADESGEQPNVADAIIKQATSAGIVIDTLWTGPRSAATRNTLIRLAERTGGSHSDVVNPARVGDDLRTALNRATARVNNAVVVTFDRRVQAGGLTEQVGVQLARPGIAPTVMALRVPRSAAGPTTSSSEGLSIMQMVMRVLLVLVLGFLVYVAIRVLVFKHSIWDVLVIGRIINNAGLTPTPEPVRPPPSPVTAVAPPPAARYTRVAEPIPVAHAAHPANALSLDVVEGPLAGKHIQVQGTRFQIGASSTNDLQIESDKYLSGTHAVIQTSKNGWLVLDRGSSNGTYVDGRKVGSGGLELRDGQRLRVGESEFKVVLKTSTAVSEPPASVEPAPR